MSTRHKRAPRQLDRMAKADPVAWVRFRRDGCYEGPIMNEQMGEVRKKSGAWTALHAAPRLPRDVLMAVVRDVQRAAIQSEPVNKQMLSVLKRIVDTCNSADFDGEPSAAEMKAAEEAIAAAESAQAQHELNLPVPDDVLKDAARWKFIKQIASEDGGKALSVLVMYCGLTECDTDELDSAIDKAMHEAADAEQAQEGGAA